jgi:hypothetical protein
MGLTFIELCLQGDCEPEEIDDFVDEWHDNQIDIPLSKFLGMTAEEYEKWLVNSNLLLMILEARRK